MTFCARIVHIFSYSARLREAQTSVTERASGVGSSCDECHLLEFGVVDVCIARPQAFVSVNWVLAEEPLDLPTELGLDFLDYLLVCVTLLTPPRLYHLALRLLMFVCV